MKKKQLLALFLATTMIATTLGGSLSTVYASEYNYSAASGFTDDVFDENFSMDSEELKDYGLSSSEIEQFNNFVSSGINVLNGELFGNIDTEGIQTRGKFSKAVKLIKKAYKKLPTKVKTYIAKYTKLNVLLNLIEHYTGSLEGAIYNACRKVGMPKNIANFVTKTIMLFIV